MGSDSWGMGNGDASSRRRRYECKAEENRGKKNVILLEAVNKPDRRQENLMRAAASDSFLEAFIYLDRLYKFKLK
jgi:hypothetical protein